MPAPQRGFTLVELLVVISIIAILSVIGITIFSSTQKGARDAKRKEDLNAIYLALEQYKTVNGFYPETPAGAFLAEGACTSNLWPSSANYIPGLAPNFIQQLPGDPNVNGIEHRCYIYRSDRNSYIIAAHMGVEGRIDSADRLIRQIAPDCTTLQPTYSINSEGPKCW